MHTNSELNILSYFVFFLHSFSSVSRFVPSSGRSGCPKVRIEKNGSKLSAKLDHLKQQIIFFRNSKFSKNFSTKNRQIKQG